MKGAPQYGGEEPEYISFEEYAKKRWKPGWRTIQCSHCRGYGVVSHYSAYDFEGAKDCPDCEGTGQLYIRPTGHLFLYPGGPAKGMWDKKAYGRAKPLFAEEPKDES
jgi:hypothetical protein